jgi:large subunit ribosomal protein L19e
MKLNTQKRIAASKMKVSKKRIIFNIERLEDIKEAITKLDIIGLVKDGAIKVKQKKGVSRVRAKKLAIQKTKGKRKGHGSRKGSHKTRVGKKKTWMLGVRLKRKFIKELKEKDLINNQVYRDIYRKIGGGFFRSKRHIKLYVEEHKLWRK